MSDNLLLLEFMECDHEASTARRKKRCKVRQQSDPFSVYDETEFIKRYRLSKQLALDLCEELRPLFRQPIKTTDLTVEKKILTALSFYATGSRQRPIGDIGAHSMAQQTVSAVLAEVTANIDTPEMRKKYICFPKTVDERNKTQARFYEKFKFPGVLGCIDCIQVAIVRPAEHEERYYCRKYYHTLNVQLICDADMQITSVDASFGGTTHGSVIWNMNPVKEYLESVNESTWLLGDSEYPLSRYMMTPIINAVPGSPESHYTEVHVRTRSVIEHTISLLKERFRCLSTHKALHYSPKTTASIINTCVILHNICNRANIPVLQLNDEDTLKEKKMQTFLPNVESGSREGLQQGVDTRKSIVYHLWQDKLYL